MHPTRIRLATALATLTTVAALATLTACSGSGSDPDSAGGSSLGSVEAEVPAADDGAALPDGDAADALAGPDGDTGAVRSTRDDSAGEPVDPGTVAVISTGTVSLEADDVADARFDVRRIVDQHRGAVTGQETTTSDDGEVSSARLVLRVPSARFDDAQAALEQVGQLRSSDSSQEDVSTEVIDIEARIRAQRKSVARIEALLARASTLGQLVSIESQLASRQADLDSLVSRQKWLADQTSLSTITVYIERTEEEGDEDDEDATGFLGGLEDGWDAFVAGGGVALTVLGFALPWLGFLLLLALPVWLVARRRGVTS